VRILIGSITIMNKNAITLIVSISLLFGGCAVPTGEDYSVDYENARRATIEAWEEVIGRVSDRCYDRSVDAMVTEAGYFPESCISPTGNYVGCYMATEHLGIGGDMIYILETRTDKQKLDTAVHEYIHLLATCEFINPDPFHEDKRFWDDFGSDTVEAHGCANLRL
jgi:hypothetical protein